MSEPPWVPQVCLPVGCLWGRPLGVQGPRKQARPSCHPPASSAWQLLQTGALPKERGAGVEAPKRKSCDSRQRVCGEQL